MLGQTISGRYQIVEQLGKGAMGTTFIAIDKQRPGHPRCVVKKFTPIFEDPKSREIARRLFDQEAQTLEKLGSHDQIPRLLAYFEENEEFYLVQELITGKDLNQELANKRLNEAETVELVKDVLRVLVFVQENKVIHRDLKPSNLIRREQDHKIILIDFGAVKEISSQTVDEHGQTKAGTTIGTPGYMPREQYYGTPGFYSDIYALGMIGIQALTGISPEALPRDDYQEVLWRDQTTVSSGFADILDKMIRENYRERFQSAKEVLAALNETNPTQPTIVTTSLDRGEGSQETILTAREHSQRLKPPLKKSESKKGLLVGLSVGISAVIAIGGAVVGFNQLQSPGALESFQEEKYSVKIDYPKTWEVQETPSFLGDTITFLSPLDKNDNFREEVSLTIEDLSASPMSLSEYTNSSMQQIRNSADQNAPEPINSTLSKSPGMRVEFTAKQNDQDVQILQTWTLRNNKAYTITYIAQKDRYNKYLKQVEQMIGSFEIIQ